MIRSRKILILGILLLVSIVVAGYLLLWGPGSRSENDELDKSDNSVSTAVLETRDLRVYKELDGILKYGDSFSVSPGNSGVLTYIAPQGSELTRGMVIYRFYRSISETEYLAADQQVASAEASLIQAQNNLENLKEAPSKSQIASANASVSQAELNLKNLMSDPEAYEISSANASVAQAKINLDNVLTTPSDASLAAAELSVQQRKSTLASSESAMDTSWISFRMARRAYCEAADNLDVGSWINNYEICPDLSQTGLTPEAVDELIDRIFIEEALIDLANSLINTHVNFESANTSYETAILSLQVAEMDLQALNQSPSDDELTQSSENLQAVEEQRNYLQSDPEQLAIDQATQSLNAAREQRTELNQGVDDNELRQAEYSLQSARLNLQIALSNRDGLVDGPSAVMLMFGETPAWRDFAPNMSPGIDIEQLKINLIALGYVGGLGDEFTLDQNYDASAISMVKELQEDLGLTQTGRLDFGDIVFLPGISLVEYSSTFPSLGSNIGANVPLMSLVPIVNVNTSVDTEGQVSETAKSLQNIETSIDVADKDLIDIGTPVKIELPDESIISGKVTEIGRTAVIPSNNQNTDPYLEVSIQVDNNVNLPEWTGANVIVSITRELADDVLAAPVTSLMALLGGGYALEIYKDIGTELVPVTVGVYSDGWIEIKDTELLDGTRVVVPK